MQYGDCDLNIHFISDKFYTMTFEEVDVDAVADLSPEDVEAREVFGESKVEGVNNPFLDFLLSGGDVSGISVGGRRRNARIQSGETSRSDGDH